MQAVAVVEAAADAALRSRGSYPIRKPPVSDDQAANHTLQSRDGGYQLSRDIVTFKKSLPNTNFKTEI